MRKLQFAIENLDGAKALQMQKGGKVIVAVIYSRGKQGNGEAATPQNH
jgi:hypothetical protein